MNFNKDFQRIDQFTANLEKFFSKTAKGFPLPPGVVRKPMPVQRKWTSGKFRVEMVTRAGSKPGFGKIMLYYGDKKVGTLRIDSAPIEEVHGLFNELTEMVRKFQKGE